MKLSKLYSSDSRFKTIYFNPNFNVILGEISNFEDLTTDSHNLGKSTLISLIDFMLLKELDKNSFLRGKSFENHIFYLELVLNCGKYITIKRSTKNASKISFKLHKEARDVGETITVWDYEELPMSTQDETKNPRVLLNGFLAFDVLKGESFRKTSGYFLRTQDDYKDVFKLQKYRGKDIDWKPNLFELLGFNSEHMINKYIIEAEISTKENLLQKVKEEFQVDAGEKDRIKGLIELAELKRIEIKKWLDKFDFYQRETGISKELVENVEKKIASLNTARYNIEYELEQIRESLKVKVHFDIDELLEIYKDVQIYFPDALVKDYQELLEFNKKLSDERLKYLEKIKHEKEEKLSLINIELSDLNTSRTNMLSGLQSSDTFEKYSLYRDDLIHVEREIERHIVELEHIDNVKNIQKDIDELYERLKKETDILGRQVDESTAIYRAIRRDFHDFVNEILGESAMISISINGNDNIDFKTSFYNVKNEETSQGLGHTYRKILCACFDLAIVKNYMNQSFYRFIYHDGCLESLDPRKRKKYLDLVRRVSQEHGIQYIMTSLASDIPKGENYEIKQHEVAVVLTDKSDDSGRLFGFEF